MTSAAPSDQRLPITSGICPSLVCRSPSASACCMPNSCKPIRAAGRNAHPAPITTDRAFPLNESDPRDVHPVADEPHPGAALQEKSLRDPGPELRHRVEVRGADVALRGINRHPVDFGADVHARGDAIADIAQHRAGVAIRIVALAGLTVAAQRRGRAAGHQPQLRRAVGRLAGGCLRGCLGKREDRSKRQAQAAHPGADRKAHETLHVK